MKRWLISAALLISVTLVPVRPATAELSEADRSFIDEIVTLIETHHGESHDHDDLLKKAEKAVEEAYEKSASVAGPPPVSPAETGIKALVESLGPHNFYATGSQFELRQAWFSGAPKARLGLIGTTTADGFAIRMVFPDGPADKADIRPDDLVIAINGKSITGKSRKQVGDLLGGTAGEKITLTVRRHDKTVDLVATFGEIDTASVLSRRFDDIGYLWVNRFNRQTEKGFRQSVGNLTPFGPAIEPINGLIIDLRNNQGGYLREAITLSDNFLSTGRIASVNGRHEKAPRLYDAKDGEEFRNLPVVILVNKVTRSSAEIFAAALRDNGRAILMGQTSYGKGVGQRTYKVKSTGGSLTLVRTIVTPPSGALFDGVGLKPDIALRNKAFDGLDTTLCPPLPDAPFSDPEIGCAIAYLKAGSVAKFYEMLGGTAGPGQELPQ